jgi:hypothetical protein
MFLDAIRVGRRRHAPGSLGATVELRTAVLGDRASVLGALLLAQCGACHRLTQLGGLAQGIVIRLY